MSLQSTKTDNKSIANKIFIRKEAIKNLQHISVLDLFAGRNVLWNNINKNNYFGIEIQKGKGLNLCSDSRFVLPSIDMSEFNVIDCDSYGIAFDIYEQLLSREDVKRGTIIIYTAITNEFTTLQNYAREYFGFKDFYYKAPSLFNARAIEFFYEFLAAHGINEVFYYSIRDKFQKDYGFFIK